ncbi:hypothetical protein EDE09_11078 [Neorhizobium sp. S3-V5DH]|nr:hypothetical protein EDE09_11078 [Neorhizobium sp. S3-V5DH]
MTTEKLIRETTRKLQERLISRIAEEKAYDVPAFCVAIGLMNGTKPKRQSMRP